MSDQLIARVAHTSAKKKIPQFSTGFTVRVHQKIKEGNKERVQVFEGLVIKTNSGKNATDKTFTVRKVASGVGVEKIFPLHSPNIAKIEIVKKAKIRRAKLYYMRERFGKSARFKEHRFTKEEAAALIKEMPELEAVAEEKADDAPDTTPEQAPEATPETTPEQAPETTEEAPADAPSEEKPAEEAAPSEEPAKTEAPEETTDEPAADEEKKEEASE